MVQENQVGVLVSRGTDFVSFKWTVDRDFLSKSKRSG